MRIQWLVLLVLAAAGGGIVGCGGSEEAPDDPNRTEPTSAEVRELAAELANTAFRDKKIKDASGRIVQIKPDAWKVAEIKGDFWVFAYRPATGPQADVSFPVDPNKMMGDIQVEVGYVPE
jgi:hypothetical protein